MVWALLAWALFSVTKYSLSPSNVPFQRQEWSRAPSPPPAGRWGRARSRGCCCVLTGARTAPRRSRAAPGTGPSAATRCPYQILTRRGLCSARQSTRQTRQSNAPLPLLLPRGSGGSHSHSWALSGAGSSLLDPELPPSSAAAYSRTVTASFCISSFSTASHSPRSPLLKRARPPYQPYLWLSQPQRGRRVGS